MVGDFKFCPNKAARLIHVLAHDDRLKIMMLIADHEWNVTSLARETKLGQAALSRHLKKMRDIGVVQTRRSAQTIYYSCTNAAVVRLLETLTLQPMVSADLDRGAEKVRTSGFLPDRVAS